MKSILINMEQQHVAVVVKTVLGSHFGVGAPPILVYFSGDRDVHWGYGVLTHGHVQLAVPSIKMQARICKPYECTTSSWDSDG